MENRCQYDCIPGVDKIGLAAVFFCHDGQGNVLMQKRSKRAPDEQDRWDIGGGKIEFGETAYDAMKRELMEEYGVEPLRAEWLGFREYPSLTKHWIDIDFRIQVDRTKVLVGEPLYVNEIRWFTRDEILDRNALGLKMHTGMDRFLEYPNLFRKTVLGGM